MQAVFDAIGNFFTEILKYISDFTEFLTLSFLQIFKDIWELLTDIVIFFIESALSLVVTVLEACSIPIPNIAFYWGSLPSDLTNILGLIGLKEALTIIVCALLLRFSLQLIPFTRLGS